MRDFYIYDAVTGEFVAAGKAQESPLEPGVWGLPECATFEEPPEVLANEAAVWGGEGWRRVPDFRGQVFWSTADQARHEIKVLDEMPCVWWTEQEPYDAACVWNDEACGWVLPFEVKKARRVAALRRAADASVADLQADYSRAEVESWPRQEAGARLLLMDEASEEDAAVFVRMMAQERGMDTAVMVEKILSAAEAYARSTAVILGMLKGAEDAVKRAATDAELDAVKWIY